MEWSEEQAAAAERKVQENSSQRVCQEKQGAPSGPSMVSTTSVLLDVLFRRGQRTEAAGNLGYWIGTELRGRKGGGGDGQG